MNSAAIQRAVKAKHFRSGLYYSLQRAVSVEDNDEFESGTLFKYKKITDERTLRYLSSHISIQANDIVIETYNPLLWVVKGKVRLGASRLLQIKTVTPEEEEISPVSRVVKYTLTLG